MKKKLKFSHNPSKKSRTGRKKGKKAPRKVVVLMSMPTPIHAVTAVLDMPYNAGARATKAHDIITACTGNAYVTIAPATITAATAKLTAYTSATTAAERAAAYPPLHNTLKSFMALFQEAANNDIANAIVIIESGDFKVKNMSIPQKHEFKAENGAINGHVDLSAEGGPGGSVHNWKYSTDGINYTWLRGTSAAHTHHITGLAKGAKIYYIHELSVLDIPEPESQAFELIIT